MNTQLSPNSTLSHYRIVSKIGAGGMGEVYMAHDTKLDRTVAIKVLPEQVAVNKERMRRFVQEARAASALNHPNIITIHEIDQDNSIHFIATEFIDGETLRSRMSHTPMKLSEVLDISIQMASALAAAHKAGIIHRDIKPENVMVRRDGIVKILDFGLAKLTAAQPTPVDTQTTTKALFRTDPGIVVGTATYMSPEQARGLELDAGTDIFSLGVVVYELVTGCLPFAGATTSEVLAAILSEKEPPPLARFARDIPAELERIVEKALRKNREERYQTAKDMFLDLSRLTHKLEVDAEIERTLPPKLSAAARGGKPSIGGEVASTRQATTAAAMQRTLTTSRAEYVTSEIKKHKLVAFSILAAIIVLSVTALISYFYFGRGESRASIDSIAVLPLANVSGSAETEYLADGMTETLIISLSQLPHLSVKARSSVFRYKGKEIDPQKVAAELSVQAIVIGRVVQRGDDLTLYLSLVDARNGNQLWGEQYNRKMTDLVALQGEIARDVSQRLRLRLTGTEQQRLIKQGTQNTEAYQAYLRGRFYWNKGRGPGFEKSREYYQQAIDLDPTYSLAYAGLADYYGFALAVGLLPPNENWPKAEAAVNKALALDDTLAETYNPLAAVQLYYYRDWPAAERAFRRGIELNPNFAEIHAHYAACLKLFGRNEEALAEAQRSVELDPLSPRYNYFRGRILLFMGQYDRAIDQFRQTLEIDPNYVTAHEALGGAYEQKGMQREAVAEWGKALILRGAGEQASSLERTYATSGFEAAVRALAREQLAKLNERMKRGEYVAAGEYVTAYTRLGDKEQAFAWLDKAVQERNGFVFVIKVDPIYDKLRADPRFPDLLRP